MSPRRVAVLTARLTDGTEDRLPIPAEFIDQRSNTGKVMRLWLNQCDPPADKATLRQEIPEAGGVREVTYQWDADVVTAEHFQMALDAPRARLAAEGAEQLHARRWLIGGPLRLFAAKEVGPPRWRWPHLGLWINRRRVHVLAGWNYTAYHATLSWKDTER